MEKIPIAVCSESLLLTSILKDRQSGITVLKNPEMNNTKPEMPKLHIKKQKQNDPDILTFAKDPANICTLSGLIFALIAIKHALDGQYNDAYAFSLVSTCLDYLDGWIARHTNGRTKLLGQIGLQLDSLVDVINYGIVTVIILLEVSYYSTWAYIIAFIYLSCCCLRLAFFNVCGIVTVPGGKQYYHGLPLDHNAILLGLMSLIFAYTGWKKSRFVFACCLIILSYFNTSAIKISKIGNGIAFLLTQILILTLALFNCLLETIVLETNKNSVLWHVIFIVFLHLNSCKLLIKIWKFIQHLNGISQIGNKSCNFCYYTFHIVTGEHPTVISFDECD